MVRRADELFLAIAVKNELLDKRLARSILDELKGFESTGEARKARHLVLERGLMSDKVAKQIKQMVMDQLAQEKTQSSGASTPKPESKARRSVAGFSIGEAITSGRVARFYRAQHQKSGAPVIALLLSEEAVSESDQKAWQKGLKSTQKLRHLNLIPITEFGEDKGQCYVIFEAPQGAESLSSRMERGELLDEREATRLALAMSELLSLADREGILHGHISPELILYESGSPRLLGLGAIPAGILTRNFEDSQCRPAEALAAQGCDLRADIYGLGASIYAGGCGKLPYASIEAIRFDPLTPLSGRARGYTPGFCSLVEAMMNRDRDKRYQSFEALSSDLDNVLAGFAPALNLGSFKGKATAESKPGGGGNSARSKGAPKSGRRSKRASQNTGFAPDEDEASDNESKPKRRREVEMAGASPMLPIAALGLAALAFIGAVFAFGGGGRGPVIDDSNPIVDTRPGETEGDALKRLAEQAATNEFEALRGVQGWPRLRGLERLVESFPRSELAKKCSEEIDSLRRRLVNEEKSYIDNERLAVNGMREQGLELDAVTRLRSVIAKLQHPPHKTEIESEVKALDSARLQRLTTINNEVERLAKGRAYEQAIAMLKESLGLRDDKAKIDAQSRIAQLEADRKRDLAATKQADQEKDRAALTELEAIVVEKGPEGQFKLIAEKAREVQATVTSPEIRDKVEFHVKACNLMVELDNLVSAAALDILGETIEVKKLRGAPLTGKLVQVDSRGGLVIQVRGGDITINREDLDLDTKELLVKKLKSNADKGLIAVGLTRIYQGRLGTGFKRIEKVQREGSTDAIYFTGRKKYIIDLFGKIETETTPTEPAIVERPKDPKPDPGEPKPPEPTGPQLSDDALARLVYDNREKLFRTATEVGFGGGRTDALYIFQGAKKLSEEDWLITGSRARIYPSAERQALVLEGSGSFFHKAVQKTEALFLIRFSYEGSLVSNSELKLVLIDDKKKEEYHSIFGQQMYQYKKGKKARFEGLKRINLELLRPKTFYQLEIGYRDGQVFTKLEGDQNAIMDGVGIAKARVGLVWNNMSINVLSIRVQGYCDEEWVTQVLEDEEKKKKR